ncbi:MAG: chloride channel protein [Truepera sp.]|jgi:CIC family chloride channel protein|nr:chloride channel protein [Truepera sp.]
MRWLLKLDKTSRLVFLSIIVGVVGAAGSHFFLWMVERVSDLLIVGIGHMPVLTTQEASELGASPALPLLNWLIPVSTTLGGLLAGILVFSVAPEAEGHGTDAAIRSFHRLGGYVRTRVPIVKIIASALTIGSGGSAGREGPTAQIASGFGSITATWLKLPDDERRTLMLVGMAAGLSAIFRSPLGTAILAVEVLYSGLAFESAVLVYTFIGAATAYAISGSFTGFAPLFKLVGPIGFTGARELPWYALLGIMAGLLGALMPRVYYGIRDAFGKLRMPKHLKPAVGGLAMGLIAMVFPQLLGTGYGWMQLAIDGNLGLWLMLALALGKLVTMALTIGSGGSGGIFGPSLYVGVMLGGGMAAALHGVTTSAPAPQAFAVVGMAAVFAGAARVPLATLIMVAEMTGGYQLILPTMLAVAISFMVQERLGHRAKYPTLYESAVENLGDSPVHQGEYLQTVVNLLRKRVVTLDPTILDREFVERLSRGEGVPMSDGNEMVYMTEVPEDSVVVGLEIRQLPIPSDVLVVSILHDAVAIIPDGLSRLSAGDKLTVVATPTSMEAFKLMLAEKAPEAEAV